MVYSASSSQMPPSLRQPLRTLVSGLADAGAAVTTNAPAVIAAATLAPAIHRLTFMPNSFLADLRCLWRTRHTRRWADFAHEPPPDRTAEGIVGPNTTLVHDYRTWPTQLPN